MNCFIMQFNCFLLMPIVDKLPALLREELENAFEDDLDSIFDITNLRQSLDQKKRSTEIELRRVKPNLNSQSLCSSCLTLC